MSTGAIDPLNEIADVCEAVGADIQDVSRGVKITLVSRDTTPPVPGPTR